MVVGLEASDEQRVPQGTAAAAPARPGYSSSTPVARGYSLYWMMNAPAICATMSSAMRNQVSGSANGSKRPRERIFQARLRNATLIVAPVSTAVFADDKPNPTSCREAKRTSTLRAECRVPHRVCCCKLRVVCSVYARLLRMTAGVDPSTKRIWLPSRTGAGAREQGAPRAAAPQFDPSDPRG